MTDGLPEIIDVPDPAEPEVRNYREKTRVWLSKWIFRLYGVVILISLFILIASVFNETISTNDFAVVVSALVGPLHGLFAAIIGFYFGESSSS